MRRWCSLFVGINSLASSLRLQAELPNKTLQHFQEPLIDDEDVEDIILTIRKSEMEYDFTSDRVWQRADFETKWAIFQNSVPLASFQANSNPELDAHPVCQPSLVGPKGSKKLAILMHGFLACPGLWYRVVPLLVSHGYRVMLPTLPGHGRTWRFPGKALNNTVVDLGDGRLEADFMGEASVVNGSIFKSDLSDAEDDIEKIPTDALPYQIFAKTLGAMATQFKREHPDGIVVAAGHSLGGAVTARYAMDIPEVVDSVMLLNPMLGLASSIVSIATFLTPSMRLSKGSKCEGQRDKGSGGVCQFRLSHVKAMSSFATSMLCDSWGVLKGSGCATPDASGRYSRKFGTMKNFQMVTSRSENMVDNNMIEKFVKEVQRDRRIPVDLPHYHDASFCYWPSELGHSYLSNRKKTSSSEKWWHPYVENAVADFLVSGKNVEIVKTGDPNDCLLDSTNVHHRSLTLLPAMQHSDYYLISTSHAHKVAHVKFSGDVKKESHGWGRMNQRHMEVLRYDDDRVLIVTRKHANDPIRNIYDIRKNDLVGITKDGDILCIVPKVDDVYPVAFTLERILKRVDARRKAGYTPRELHFCGVDRHFMTAVCKMVECAVNWDTNSSEIAELLGEDAYVPTYSL